MGMHLERYGRGDRVLFIHGAGGSTASWRFQKTLQDVCDVILIDLPGHGKSEGPSFPNIDGYAECVRTVIEENGLEGCCLAGHSMGGAIACRLAVTCPEILSGLVLIGTGARLRVLPRILEGIMQNKEGTVRAIMDLAFSKKAAPGLMEACRAEMTAAPKVVIYDDFAGCDKVDLMESVKSISLPALVIAGADDLLTPPKYSEYLARQIERARLSIIPEAGHMVMIEKPEETNRAIKAFTARR